MQPFWIINFSFAIYSFIENKANKNQLFISCDTQLTYNLYFTVIWQMCYCVFVYLFVYDVKPFI